ncbi:MAG: hypothetical protein ACLRS8_05880 [Parabacteroides merdae]
MGNLISGGGSYKHVTEQQVKTLNSISADTCLVINQAIESGICREHPSGRLVVNRY